MKVFLLALLVFSGISNSRAGGNIIIRDGCGIRVPSGSQICADTIDVKEFAFYITDIPDGTCPEAVITGTGNIVLPVELSSFTAEVENEYVILRWTTETEKENLGFDIERRYESEVWEKVTFIEGFGNSNSPRQYHYKDKISPAPTKIVYRLKQIDFNGDYTYSDETEVNILPSEFGLTQNYPNPFNPSTIIQFSIPEGIDKKIKASLKVYDILGNLVSTLVDEALSPGRYEFIFNASELSSGVYFYRFNADRFVKTNKMILLR